MIIIQAILLVILLVIFIRLISARGSGRTNAYKKLALLLFVIAAVIAVLFPQLLTALANLVGVGRGADLLLYGLTVVVVFQLLNGYIKDKEEQQRFVRLVRKVAIMEAVSNASEDARNGSRR